MTLHFLVHLPLNTVFENLTDMQRYVSYHPVITQIDRTGTYTYLVHETLKFGPLPISFTYPVKLERDNTTKKVIFKAQVMKINHITMAFELVEKDGLTHITETITFKTPLPVRSLMGKIFKAQHTQLFENMDAGN
ncbi:MAG: SRPBCC family protein [Pedobacter sp.]|nr:MAG: SRPBCC family protein [Pedobacter sp.]